MHINSLFLVVHLRAGPRRSAEASVVLKTDPHAPADHDKPLNPVRSFVETVRGKHDVDLGEFFPSLLSLSLVVMLVNNERHVANECAWV